MKSTENCITNTMNINRIQHLPNFYHTSLLYFFVSLLFFFLYYSILKQFSHAMFFHSLYFCMHVRKVFLCNNDFNILDKVINDSWYKIAQKHLKTFFFFFSKSVFKESTHDINILLYNYFFHPIYFINYITIFLAMQSFLSSLSVVYNSFIHSYYQVLVPM